MTKDDTTDARERKRSQNRAAQKTYRERMKRKIEDLEKWRDVALAMTSADNLGRVIPDSSDPSQHKSQSPVDIDFLDAEPCTASAPPRQLLSPISTPQVLQYGPGPSIADTVPQHPVTSGIDDILSLDWNNFRTSETIPAYEAGLPSQPKKVVWDMFSPSQSSLHATRQRSKSIVSVEDFGDGSLRKAAYEPWSQNETLADLGAATGPGCDSEIKGKTAFHLAAQRGQRNLVALLLRAVNDLNSRDSLGRTALHLAAESGHPEVVGMLLEARRQSNRNKAQVANINAQDGEGRSPLHLAVNKNCYSTIAVLVKNPGIDIELKDDAGLTPLHQSILAGHEEIVELLIANGADLNVKIG